MSKELPEALTYEGYEIRPAPLKVRVGAEEHWNTQFEIWVHSGKESTVFPFTGKPTFKSKEDAVKWCFPAGKHIIDNEPEKLANK